jgi:eukaryotic-like serine/threonine-protein kinase
MGAVYAALDTRLERRLAMKVMLPKFAADTAARERFLREARAAARIKHDNVVTVYEADERQGVPYIAMEYLEGYPLDEYLAKKGNPSIPQVLRIAAEAAAGLAAAHKLGLVHRDIKPGNLWLEAPNGRVKVLDFGLAKPIDAEVEITRSGAVVGTPAYMSPEQARGNKVDHRSDLFSLGGLLYRLCTGTLPFSGPNTMAVLMALGTEEPPPVRSVNPAVPEPLAELIHELLSKNADKRPQSAAEVVKRLRAIAAELATPRALPVEESSSQPQVVYVPMQVTALPQQNPFADLDSPDTERISREFAEAAAPPSQRMPGSRRQWLSIGFAALAALVFGGVIIIIKNKDGTETKIEVPDGATVTVKDKGGKTLAQVKPAGGKPTLDPDRKAAEYALSIGGAVRVNGEEQDIRAAADLPKDPFTLTVVVLQSNRLVTDGGLANFKDCKALTYLDLNGTRVGDAGLAHFKGCKLTHINFANTQVTDVGLSYFRGSGLTALYLVNTRVTDTGIAYFSGCTSLYTLWLSGTQVTDAGLAHLKGCKSLTELNLHGTKVGDAGLAHFKDCKGLTRFGVDGTAVTDAGLAQFKDCKRLAYLYLGNTQVTDAGLAHLKDCKRLACLYLGNTQVTDAGLAHFKDCKGLTELNLNNTAVTDAGLAQFKDCTGLTYLNLNNTAVTDAGLAHFKECKGLTQLDLKKTQVTAKGLEAFHAAMPGCRIEHDGGVIEPKK